MRAESQRRTEASAPSLIPVPSRLLQRKCACGGAPGAAGECSECRKKRLHRKAALNRQTPEVPPIVHEVLRSPGQPLEDTTRGVMESRFGHTFSRVRVYTDSKAAESARAVGAVAYTVGRDVVFGSGQYTPERPEGRRLLAHELTHVIQQGGSTRSGGEDLVVSPPDHPAEREAESVTGATGKFVAPGDVGPLQVLPAIAQHTTLGLQRQTSAFSAKKSDPNSIIPIKDFIHYVEIVEKSYPKDTRDEIVTRLRLLYYSGIAFSQLLPGARTEDRVETSTGMVTDKSRAPLENEIGKDAFEHLTAHADENATGDNPSPYVKLENGERIDVGHLLLGLDALIQLHPSSGEPSHSPPGEPYKTFGVPAIDPASWVADLGIAAVEAQRYEYQQWKASKLSVPGTFTALNKLSKTAAKDPFKESAPAEDLIGDVDSFGLGVSYFAAPEQSLSQAMKTYYLGAGSLSSKGHRYRTFCATNALSYEQDGASIAWTFDRKALIHRIDRFNDLYAAGKVGSVVAAAENKTLGWSPERGGWKYTRVMLEKFLAWLKPRVEKEIADASR